MDAPGGWEWLLAAVLLVVAAGWYLSWVATRLDRLHARVEASRSALDAQLLRRATAALELGTSGLLDPASSMLLASAAHEAIAAGPAERELAESSLSRALRAGFAEPEVRDGLAADPLGVVLLEDLDTAARRVQLARRFHNDAVRASRAVRRKRVVRWLRLAGRAPLPATFEIDDALPGEAPP